MRLCELPEVKLKASSKAPTSLIYKGVERCRYFECKHSFFRKPARLADTLQHHGLRVAI